MIVISIANQKGGEGKTTTSINLSAGLALHGKKTILIDIDPQANSTSIFHTQTPEKTMYNVFYSRIPLNEILLPTKIENLWLAPANLKLAEMETISVNTVEAPFFLKDSMSDIQKNFDFCIIDCPPSLSIFTINALVASRYVIIPLQAEKFSMDGIIGLQQTITSIKKRINPELEILGGLLTQVKQQTILTKTILPILNKYFRIFRASISEGVAIGESHLAKLPIFEYNSKSRQAKEYDNFIKEVLHEFQTEKTR